MHGSVALASMISLALVAGAACSGTAGVRERSEALAVATHCSDRTCPATPPAARHLGDGCYVVEEQLYQCSTDELPAGQASCLEVPICTGACEVTITDGRFREISTDRCRALWSQDRAARRPPPRCSPVQLDVMVEPYAGAAAAPQPTVRPERAKRVEGPQPPQQQPRVREELSLPHGLVLDVVRSGKTRVLYETVVCATQGEALLGSSPTRTTGFAELDRVLAAKASDVTVAPDACVVVTLVASHFECEVEQAAM
jgi:hypothetical protein